MPFYLGALEFHIAALRHLPREIYLGGDISSADTVRRGAQARSDRQSLNPLKFKIPSPLGLNFKPRARLRRVQGEHKYARRLNGP